MPRFFTSSGLRLYDVMPGRLRLLARLNPVSYAIDSAWELFMGGIPAAALPTHGLFYFPLLMLPYNERRTGGYADGQSSINRKLYQKLTN